MKSIFILLLIALALANLYAENDNIEYRLPFGIYDDINQFYAQDIDSLKTTNSSFFITPRRSANTTKSTGSNTNILGNVLLGVGVLPMLILRSSIEEEIDEQSRKVDTTYKRLHWEADFLRVKYDPEQEFEPLPIK